MEQLGRNPECCQVGEESGEAAQEVAAMEGEETQESQSNQKLNHAGSEKGK